MSIFLYCSRILQDFKLWCGCSSFLEAPFLNWASFNFFTHLVNLVSPWGNIEELGLIGTNFLTLFASFVSFENALTSFWCIATPDSIVSRINSGFKYGKMGWWIRVMAPSDGWGIFCWDDWPTYNQFITCFRESWIHEIWIFSMKFVVCKMFTMDFLLRIKIDYKMPT